MRKRSITNRNFCGGFCGGVLGILAFALVYSFLLPLGCLIGVVAGFWYQEIIQAFVDSWRETVVLWTVRINKTKAFLKLLFSARFVLLKVKKYTVDPLVSFFTHDIDVSFIGSFFNVKRSTFLRWIISHPMSRAYFLKITATTIFWSVNLFLGVFLWHVGSNFIDSAKPENAFPLFFFMGLCLWGFAVIALPIGMFSNEGETKDRMRYFYKEFERYSEKGAFHFFVQSLLKLFCGELGIVIVGGIAFCYLLVGVVTFLILVFLPVAVFVSFGRKVYCIATREDHWLCLIVTLVVTTFFAWLTHSYLSNSIVLWTVALGTGCVSGVVSELARKSIAEAIKRSEFMFNLWTFSLDEFLCSKAKILIVPIDKIVDYIL